MARTEVTFTNDDDRFHPDAVKVQVVDLFAQQDLLRNRAGDYTTQVRLTVPDPDPYSPTRDEVVLIFDSAADALAVLEPALRQLVPVVEAQAAEHAGGAA